MVDAGQANGTLVEVRKVTVAVRMGVGTVELGAFFQLAEHGGVKQNLWKLRHLGVVGHQVVRRDGSTHGVVTRRLRGHRLGEIGPQMGELGHGLVGEGARVRHRCRDRGRVWRRGYVGRVARVDAGKRLTGSRAGRWRLVSQSSHMADPTSAIGAAIPPVFDSIIASASEMTSDFRPLLAVLGHKLLYKHTLLCGDGVAIERGLQVLVVALTALFGQSGTKESQNTDPVRWALDGNDGHETAVLVRQPGASADGSGSVGAGTNVGVGRFVREGRVLVSKVGGGLHLYHKGFHED